MPLTDMTNITMSYCVSQKKKKLQHTVLECPNYQKMMTKCSFMSELFLKVYIVTHNGFNTLAILYDLQKGSVEKERKSKEKSSGSR